MGVSFVSQKEMAMAIATGSEPSTMTFKETAPVKIESLSVVLLCRRIEDS